MKLYSLAVISTLFYTSSILAAGAHTPPTNSCPFTDTFHLSGPAVTIRSGINSSGGIIGTKINDTEFTTSCNQDIANDGTVNLDIGLNDQDKCSFTILDGAFQTNPTVQSVQCFGNLAFNGIDHVTFSYDYTMKFSQK